MAASARLVLTDYFEAAMKRSRIELLGDGTFVGRVDGCLGLLSFAKSEAEALEDLRSTLEEWVLLGLKFRHELPVLDGIDLNGEPVLEPVDAH